LRFWSRLTSPDGLKATDEIIMCHTIRISFGIMRR
jgi:hypothetical protein